MPPAVQDEDVEAPVRTEADIRAALAELGRRAPSADAVLSAMREAGLQRPRGLPELPGPPRRRASRRWRDRPVN